MTVAVLLDNFVAETARERGNENELKLEAMRSKDSMGNVLDPLLKVLANEYIDRGDLDNFLTVLFHNLDVDSSGELTRSRPSLPPRTCSRAPARAARPTSLLALMPRASPLLLAYALFARVALPLSPSPVPHLVYLSNPVHLPTSDIVHHPFSARGREETILGFRRVHPGIPVHFSAPDFDVLTRHGKFLNHE